MHWIPDGDGDGLDDPGTCAPEARTTGSRRLLLGAAAGGLAMTASGLWLPPRLVEEAEAADHPVGNVQNRRRRKRDKRRRQLKQRRDQRDDRRDAPGSGFRFRTVETEVQNLIPDDVLHVTWFDGPNFNAKIEKQADIRYTDPIIRCGIENFGMTTLINFASGRIPKQWIVFENLDRETRVDVSGHIPWEFAVGRREYVRIFDQMRMTLERMEDSSRTVILRVIIQEYLYP